VDRIRARPFVLAATSMALSPPPFGSRCLRACREGVSRIEPRLDFLNYGSRRARTSLETNGGHLRQATLAAAALLAALAGPTAAADRAPARLPIRSAQWIAPAAVARSLSFAPSECARPPEPEEARRRYEIGRAAFRAPLLLGGQAARVGLSCNSCHSNGRRNDGFLFPGLSGSPGTADVTSSIMSSHRGNGVFDPRPIPDLAVSRKIAREGGGDLERFISGLITEEFDGAPPDPLILDAVASYVRAIVPSACPPAPEQAVRLADRLADADRAVQAAAYAWDAKDGDAARLLLSSARAALGEIYERFDGPTLAWARARLRRADLGLLAIQQAIDRQAPDVPLRLAGWRASEPGWAAALARAEAASLFNPQLLARRLAAPRSARVPPAGRNVRA